jgi:N-methylhydantoinase A
VLDVLGLLAEQLGRPLPEMLAHTHHIAHGTTSALNTLVTGIVPAIGSSPPRATATRSSS